MQKLFLGEKPSLAINFNLCGEKMENASPTVDLGFGDVQVDCFGTACAALFAPKAVRCELLRGGAWLPGGLVQQMAEFLLRGRRESGWLWI